MDELTKDEAKALHDQIKGLRAGARCNDDASPLERLAYFALHFFELVLGKEVAKYGADGPAQPGP